MGARAAGILCVCVCFMIASERLQMSRLTSAAWAPEVSLETDPMLVQHFPHVGNNDQNWAPPVQPRFKPPEAGRNQPIIGSSRTPLDRI